MTECERLIQEGKLEDSFLNRETRCGYIIEPKIKKLWALQIDLMKQIEAICDRHNLAYFLIGGGGIGAVRHKGCIPWDDDIDVALKREDYNQFMEYAQTELQAPYFLQTPLTDSYFWRPFIVIRNSNSTCIARGDQRLQCNNGVCIHIFPLDGFENNFECKMFCRMGKIKNVIAVTSYNASSAQNHKLVRKILKILSYVIFPFGMKKFFIHINKKATRLSKKYTKRIGIQYAHFTTSTRYTWDADIFNSAIKMPFEYTELSMAAGWHELLSHSFGNYMEFPPENQRGNKHTFEIEPDMPYKEYCSKNYGVRYD